MSWILIFGFMWSPVELIALFVLVKLLTGLTLPTSGMDSLMVDDGNISIRQGDFDTKKGLTRAPITTSDQYSITITHSHISVTTWFLKLYQLNAEYLVLRESKTYLGDHIRRGKDRVFEIINNSTGLVLDVVCCGSAKGETSKDGKQDRSFFFRGVSGAIKVMCFRQICG